MRLDQFVHLVRNSMMILLLRLFDVCVKWRIATICLSSISFVAFRKSESVG